MKKILIATSALVAVSAPAFALDVKTSGAVEYRYTKETAKNVAKNAKLSQKDAYIKFAASGASNGLAYGAWIKTSSGTATTTNNTASTGSTVYAGVLGTGNRTQLNSKDRMQYVKDFATLSGYTSEEAAILDAQSKLGTTLINEGTGDLGGSGKLNYSNWYKVGKTQAGEQVWANVQVLANSGFTAVTTQKEFNVVYQGKGAIGTPASGKANAKIAGFAIGAKPTVAVTATAGSADAAEAADQSDNFKPAVAGFALKNNASTQSAMWVNGAFGGLVIGQDGDATGLAPSGSVSAAGFTTGKQVASFTAGNIYGARATYTAPTFVDGLKLQYTQNFKGNVSADKSAKVKAPTSYGVQYATDFAGVMFKVGYAQADLGKQGSAKAIKNTKTGVELGYGGFTVGYGTFTNGKKATQKKDLTGTNYGVKYASGAWAVGYTVNKSEDKNQYFGKSYKTGNTNAISASYKVADGFNVYASKSSNKAKMSNGKTEKNSYTIIGAKISF